MGEQEQHGVVATVTATGVTVAAVTTSPAVMIAGIVGLTVFGVAYVWAPNSGQKNNYS